MGSPDEEVYPCASGGVITLPSCSLALSTFETGSHRRASLVVLVLSRGELATSLQGADRGFERDNSTGRSPVRALSTWYLFRTNYARMLVPRNKQDESLAVAWLVFALVVRHHVVRWKLV